MKKLLSFIVIVLIITSTACSKNIDRDSTASTSISENSNTPMATVDSAGMADVYILALDALMPMDKGLNSEMKYIAIDTQTLKDATDSDKKTILKYFEKYDVEIMDESMETLKTKGMVKEFSTLEGILLQVVKIEKVSDSEYAIECSKFRSGDGAIGIKCVIKKENDKWANQSTQMSWIS